MMKTKWKRLNDEIQEWKVTSWFAANVYVPSLYRYEENDRYWGWDIGPDCEVLKRGRAKTEKLAKQAAERELIKLFRELGKALDYDVE